MTLTDEACQAIIDRIGDGSIDIIDAGARVLVSVGASFKKVVDGAADVKKSGSAIVVERGVANKYVVRAHDGTPVLSGSVGHSMKLDKDKLVDGGTFTLEGFKVTFTAKEE